MMTLISQMIGCLLIAAGLGFGVGWWLRQKPTRSPEKPSHDAAGLLRTNEQAMEAMAHDLKVKTSAVQILEQKVMSSETLHSSVQRELIARNERLKALEAELTTRSKQLTTSEGEGASARRRVSEVEAILATQTHELREAQQTCRNAEQARDVMEREVGVLREHIAQLNEGLADRDRLRTQVKHLETAQDRIHQLEVELSDREAAHRNTILQLERSLAERDRRIGESDAVAATQADDLRAALQTCQTAQQAREVMERDVSALRDQVAQLNESLAERDQRISVFDTQAESQAEDLRAAHQASQSAEQAREVLKEEIRVLRDHIAQLNEGLADRDRLRAQVKQLKTAQDRIHQLEVELSDREAAHRSTILQLERSLAERDHRIDELIPVTHLLHEKEAAIKEWERTHARTVHELKVETSKLQEQCTAHEQLQAQHRLNEQQLRERDEQLATLQRELQHLHTEHQALQRKVQSIPEKDEQIERLQKRLRELRATQRTTATAPATAPAPQPPPDGAATAPPSSPPKGSKPRQGDDLKKIQGIGPVFAETLQKLGTRTYIQIARWKPADVEKIAKKLATDPERIKRENWIAGAKKQHYDKYKERL
jgi:predicted flap endonuclease-1-like 5' DNA nuclease